MKMTLNMDSEFLHSRIEEFTQVNGKREECMERGRCLNRRDMYKKEHGLRVNKSLGLKNEFVL